MVSEYKTKTDGWQTFIKSSFMTLVVILSRLYNFEVILIKQILLILLNLSHILKIIIQRNISIELLAEISHYSPRQFTRILQIHTILLRYII